MGDTDKSPKPRSPTESCSVSPSLGCFSFLKQLHKVTFLHRSLSLLNKWYHCSFHSQARRNLGDIISSLLSSSHQYPANLQFQADEEVMLSAHLYCKSHSSAFVVSIPCDSLLLPYILHFFSRPSHSPLACQDDLRTETEDPLLPCIPIQPVWFCPSFLSTSPIHLHYIHFSLLLFSREDYDTVHHRILIHAVFFSPRCNYFPL